VELSSGAKVFSTCLKTKRLSSGLFRTGEEKRAKKIKIRNLLRVEREGSGRKGSKKVTYNFRKK